MPEFHVQASCDGSLPFSTRIRADTVDEVRERAPEVFVMDAEERGYDVTEDDIDIEEILPL